MVKKLGLQELVMLIGLLVYLDQIQNLQDTMALVFYWFLSREMELLLNL